MLVSAGKKYIQIIGKIDKQLNMIYVLDIRQVGTFSNVTH